MFKVTFTSRAAKKAWEAKKSGGTEADKLFKPTPRVAQQPEKRQVSSVPTNVHAAQSAMLKA